MSQEEVYKILKELGGIATQKQIKQRAKEKFPSFSLFQYVGNRLRKLERNGYVVSSPAIKEKQPGKSSKITVRHFGAVKHPYTELVEYCLFCADLEADSCFSFSGIYLDFLNSSFLC